MDRGGTFLLEEFDDGAVPDFARGVVDYDHVFLNRPGRHCGIEEEILEGHMVEPMIADSL